MSVTARPIPDAPHSALADTVLERITLEYPAAADPERAVGLRAYMKDVAPFLGMTSPVRRSLSRAVLAGVPRPDEPDCTAVALRCWRLPEREYHYFAVDYLRRYVTHCSSGFLPVVRHLLTTVPWWDTVDLLAAHVVGGLVTADRGLTAD
ncbi:DNA alkylation repair protein, partial [Streptomyces violaceoruber]